MRMRSPAFSSCEPLDGSFDFLLKSVDARRAVLAAKQSVWPTLATIAQQRHARRARALQSRAQYHLHRVASLLHPNLCASDTRARAEDMHTRALPRAC